MDCLIEKLIEQKQISKEEFIRILKEDNFNSSMNLAHAMGIPVYELSLIHISEPTRRVDGSRMPSSA